MSSYGRILPALAALGVVVSFAGPAVAGIPLDDAAPLPAPGALGLVALAVIGAILLARRK